MEPQKINTAYLKITQCTDCPYCTDSRYYTEDSFEECYLYHCAKSNKKIKIADWNENVLVPDWCELLKN